MRTTTTVVLAVGAATLAVPASVKAAAQSDIQAPLAGHLTVASQMREVKTELAQERLTRKAWRLARRLADHKDQGFSPVRYRRRVGDDPPATIARRIRSLRVDIKQEERRERRRVVKARDATASPTLEAIAACESGGNPGTDTGNGFYGKFQFTLQTWASVGGSGNPAQASEAEQNQRAAMLYAREGASPWPVCGR
ncbi:transglycosylase family protein [Solirubrobacter phytolaccae]|uniref:Transglycosylase family protein n=1 Tax=Solirubrobacter phytolaccae TaxID=1404360 RepID=A0A9X3NDN7_9ACTN|nr:transglycosylase family protein [Solirubrobacter phytolaccae]MDA0182977.1 transglycosylase family protein [Solirubrobacter phytolaccae]